jgi:hypothetical protein
MEPPIVGRDWSPVSSNKARGYCYRTSYRPSSSTHCSRGVQPAAVFAHTHVVQRELAPGGTPGSGWRPDRLIKTAFRLKSAAHGHTSRSPSSTPPKSATRAAKHGVYTGLVLNALLYGATSPGLSPRCSPPASIVFTWIGSERCVVSAAGTPATDTSVQRRTPPSTASTSHITHRQLRWLGHVAQMPPQRLFRKLLTYLLGPLRPSRWSSSADHTPRLSAKQPCVQRTGIELDSWYELAQDRSRWRAALRHLTPPDKTTLSDSDSSSALSSPSVSALSPSAPPTAPKQPSSRSCSCDVRDECASATTADSNHPSHPTHLRGQAQEGRKRSL